MRHEQIKYKVGIISNIISGRRFSNAHGKGYRLFVTDGYRVKSLIIWDNALLTSAELRDKVIGTNFQEW